MIRYKDNEPMADNELVNEGTAEAPTEASEENTNGNRLIDIIATSDDSAVALAIMGSVLQEYRDKRAERKFNYYDCVLMAHSRITTLYSGHIVTAERAKAINSEVRKLVNEAIENHISCSIKAVEADNE